MYLGDKYNQFHQATKQKVEKDRPDYTNKTMRIIFISNVLFSFRYFFMCSKFCENEVNLLAFSLA